MAKKRDKSGGERRSSAKKKRKKKGAPKRGPAGKKSAKGKKKSPAKKKAGGRKRTPKKKAGKRRSTAKKKPARKKPTKKKAGKTGRKAATRGKAFFDHFRQRLLAERESIERRLADLREELSGLQETPRELEEWAQEEKDRDILIRLEERETTELRRIQSALGLIDAGEYGRCQVCGKPIRKARLEELPTAFRCIDHSG